MLSGGAFNALLKTLEEPPEHVKFILATTEPQKLPATILSRCQRFDFKRISNENIVKRLEIVCKESNIEITKGALNIIAVLADGALRDALSILERCVQDGANNIDEEKIKNLVGIPSSTFIHNITKSIIEYNIENAVNAMDDVINDGKDITNILWEIIKYIKDILVYKTSNKLEIYNESEKNMIEELSKDTSKERLIDLIYNLSELENNIKWATQKTIMFEAGIIKLCNNNINTNVTNNNNVDNNNQVILNRIEKIENYLRNNKNVANNSIASTNSNTSVTKNIEYNTKINTNIKNTEIKFSNKATEYWPQILNELRKNGKMLLLTNLKDSVAKQQNDVVVEIYLNNQINSFQKNILEKPENIQEISLMVSKACGKDMNIKYVTPNNIESKTISPTQDLQNIASNADIAFNIIE